MPKSRRIIEAKEISVVNDGEFVMEEASRTYRVPQEPPYVKLYLDTIMYISDLQERHGKVFSAILRRMPFADSASQLISLTKGIKLEIAREIDRSESFVSHAIADLVKGRVLLHDDSSPRSTCYRVNPHIVARGDWKDIERLRLHIDFSARGSTFWTEVRRKSEAAEA